MKLITILNIIGFVIAIPLFIGALPLLAYIYIIKIILPSFLPEDDLQFPLTEDE